MRALYFIVYSGNYSAACHSLTDRSTMYVGQDHVVQTYSTVFSVVHFSVRMTYGTYIMHCAVFMMYVNTSICLCKSLYVGEYAFLSVYVCMFVISG